MPITLNGTTGIQNVLGSASAPAESNTTSSNTGLYFPSSTTLGLSTNGTNAVYLDASQNVGIGTTSPAAPLDVVGNVNAVSYRIRGRASDNYSLMEFVNNAGTTAYGYIGSPTANTLAFFTNGLNERMRIDSSGNVGIGTSSPSSYAYNDPAPLVVANTAGGSTVSIASGATSFGQLAFANGTSGTSRYNGYIKYDHSSNYMAFYTNAGAERMRIDSSGNVQIGTTGGPAPINVFRSTTGNPVGIFKATSTSFDNDLLQLTCSRAGATTQYLALSFYTNNYGTLQAYMRADGNWYNANSVYGSTSDARLKENIIDATPKLDSLCQLKVRNFNFISDENKTKQIGFIAQEFEEVFPSMVDENKDGDKTIKTSVLIPMLVKAIQELKAELDALKATK